MNAVPGRTVPLTVAVSPCPNDTFIFGSWVLGLGEEVPGTMASFVWADVEELNAAAEEGRFDVVKVSAAQAQALCEDWAILPCGGAFGLEHGPKLVSVASRGGKPATIAVPGLRTTALALLLRAWPAPARLVPMRYNLIVEAVRQSRVDAGLLIHESALMVENYGLRCLLDLGRWWNDRTKGLPLPLGCILGRRALGEAVLAAVQKRILASLDHALAMPGALMPLIKALAQEVDEAVIHAHLKAYVNDYSRDMGPLGRQALMRLTEFAPPAG